MCTGAFIVSGGKRGIKMVVRLVEIYQDLGRLGDFSGKSYKLREVFINPEHVVCLRAEVRLKTLLKEGDLPEGLDKRQEFTRVYMNRGQLGLDVVVVGCPHTVEEKINKAKKILLKG